MPLLRDASIRLQLRFIVMATVGLGLLMASIAFVSYEAFAYRRSIVRDLNGLANLVEASSSAALTFEDATLATHALKPLEGNKDVVSAYLFGESGTILAEYHKEGAPRATAPKRPGTDGLVIRRGHLLLIRGLELKGRRIGTLYLRADMTGLYVHFAWAAGIVAAIAGISFATAVSGSSKFVRFSSERMSWLRMVLLRL